MTLIAEQIAPQEFLVANMLIHLALPAPLKSLGSNQFAYLRSIVLSANQPTEGATVAATLEI